MAHQNSTIHFGHDPTTSALDVHCIAHEVDNLYVVDTSFFPSSGAANPALIIMANALRVGEHLLGCLQGNLLEQYYDNYTVATSQRAEAISRPLL